MKKKTIEERIEAFGEACKEQLRVKAAVAMTLEGPDAITLDGFESLWGQANKDVEKITANFFNDLMNNNLQEELLSKKKLN
jgi:hypothetical protein